MTILITDNIKLVHQVLHSAIDRLIVNRLADGAFTDQEEVKTKSYFSTLEGLESLLIPFVNLPKTYYWDSFKIKYPELIELIIDDINFVLRFNPLQELPPKEQGEPYFEHRKGPKRSSYWTSECSSFTMSVLTNFLMLRDQYGLPKNPKDNEIINVIRKNLEWVHLCKREKNGWSWTHDSPVHHWPTWSILDTFDEMLTCDQLKEFHKSIEKECDEVTETISNSFKKGLVAGSYLNDWNEKVLKCEYYDVETALDLTRLMLAVSLYGNPKIIKPLASFLFKWVANTNFVYVDYSFHLSVKADYVYDSSLVPCVFRALNVMAGILKPKKIKDIDNDIQQSHAVVMNRVYSKLMENLISHGKYKDVWGVQNGGLIYELYYTERTIEALTEFLLHYDGNDMEIISMPKLPEQEKETSKKSKAVKIDENNNASKIYLPILDEIVRNLLSNKKQAIFTDSIIIFVLHFLSDLIPFIEKFNQLGCSYEQMYFLVKTYSYPEREKIKDYLEDKRSNVFIPQDPFQKTFYNLTDDILRKCIKKSKKNKMQILIIEDGGYFVPLFHSNEFISDISQCVGAVEQTTKGYRRDEKIENHKFPIYSVATSRLKLYLEAPEVAETLQENIVSVLKEHGSISIHKIRALILGFGTIGSLLAESLFNKGMDVYIYDIDPLKRMKAEMMRKSYSNNVLKDLNDLNNFDIIIGLSGETSLSKGEDFWNLKHNVILASGSSEKIEFNLSALEDFSKEVTRQGIFTKYKVKKDDKIIRLLCDGEPINFALSSGISNLIIDPIYAEMFWCAVEISNNRELKDDLHEIPSEIELEVYRLYEKYHI